MKERTDGAAAVLGRPSIKETTKKDFQVIFDKRKRLLIPGGDYYTERGGRGVWS